VSSVGLSCARLCQCPRRDMTTWYSKLRPRTPNSRHLAHRCCKHPAASPMAHYDIFSAQLAINYPAYGHALWEPSPPRLYCPVEVGDVGFIREGRFHRLFNALLSADHPSHRIGVPEHYEPLIPSLSDHIVSSTLSPSHYCSAGIDVMANDLDIWAFG
jgi:hypothetical protein